MKITMVKKIFADGAPCKKCAEVEAKMHEAGQLERLDQVIVADEAEPQSDGMLLAAKYGVDRAPFFVVERAGQPPEVFTVYFQFVKKVLNATTTEDEELEEIMNDNPDLDFI
mgnify:FL=1